MTDIAPQKLTDNERLDWLQLARCHNVGARTFYHLLSLYHTPKKALEALPQLLQRSGNKKNITIFSREDAEQELERSQKIGAEIIAACEPDYSPLLREIHNAPPIITILGRRELLHTQSIGIVGARNASANGCRFAQKLAYDLGQNGITVISGLARGIDTAAHKGALATNTIGVTAIGIEQIYPSSNRELYHQLAKEGLIVTEFPYGTMPLPQNFPQRNRIISGLSVGTVVVEATKGSGSLITARMALEQNREIFAVPGSPLDPRCKGTNHLIKQGAHLIESAEDIIDALSNTSNVLFEKENPPTTHPHEILPTELELDKAYPIILEKLSMSAVSVDELIAQTSLSANLILTILLELELAGKLERQAGNRVALLFVGDELEIM